MELVDIILVLMYVTFIGAMLSVLWSVYRRNRKGAGRQSVQNGIPVRKLTLVVWMLFFAIVLVAAVVCKGDVADITLITLGLMLLITLGTLGWSMIRRR